MVFHVVNRGVGRRVLFTKDEAVVSSGGNFELVQHGEASCRPLNTKVIDEIVEAVDFWYDAFFAKATRETPARKRNRSSSE